jgi:hypothetical protein
MVSFAWRVDPTRYLHHLGYQIVAQPVGTSSDDLATASFTIEAP